MAALNSGAHVTTPAMTIKRPTKLPRKSRTTPRRPVLNSVAPQLFVADIETSFDFFTAKLGFVVDFIYGDPPFYAQVKRDNARFVFRLVHEPVFTSVREREGLLSAAVTVARADEIKQLFLSYQEEGVRFVQSLKKEPWGPEPSSSRIPMGISSSLPVRLIKVPAQRKPPWVGNPRKPLSAEQR